jgi:predicted Holliday junction resolvase-like endonuclease
MTLTITISLTLISYLVIWYLTNRKFNRLIQAHKNSIQLERNAAVKKSKDVTRGNIAEEFIPLFPDFPYNMSDCKFSGQPIDYIVFNGMSKLRDEGEGEITIIFADCKMNKAQLSKVQKAIKDAILNNRVKFEKWIINDNKSITIK